MPFLKNIYFLFLFLIISHPVFAGGWPQPKGGYYLKLSEWWIVSDQHFDRVGMIQPNIVEYGYYATSLYAEYGLSKKLTGFINFPFINYTYTVLPASMLKQSVWKTGDADIGMKYAFVIDNPIVASASFILGIPSGHTESNALKTGDGEFNQLLRVDASGGFTILSSNGWLNLYTGYNHRTQNYSDEIQYGFEVGMDISKDKLSVTLRLEGINALGDDENAVDINPQSLFSNHKEYMSLSPEIAYHISPSWGTTIGVGTALSGKNIFANPTFTIGIFHKSVFQNTY